MTFANLSLLLGAVLIGVPIVLHLVLRQQPKQLVFPALRFLRERRESNRRRLQLRHWLLLGLRCAAVVALAIALSRPSVNSAAIGDWAIIAVLSGFWLALAALLVVVLVQRRGRALAAGLIAAECLLALPLLFWILQILHKDAGIRWGDRESPISAVLVFDSSPRMLYRRQNRTRLEAAQELGQWLLKQFPGDSQVAVVDTHPGPAVFSVDMAAARKAIERLQTTAVAQAIPAVLKSALGLVSSGKHPRREVYILTDLTAVSWGSDATASLRQELSLAHDVAWYVLDVGVPKARNLSLADLRLSAETLSRNADLTVSTEVRAAGTGGDATVELRVEQPSPDRPMVVDGRPLLPESQVRDRRNVPLKDNGAESVSFQLTGLGPGVHQGSVVLSSGDGLAVDNVRFFAVEVTEASPVLVVAPRSVNTSFLTEAISPHQFRQTQRARFDCTVIDQSELPNRALESYAIVAILDPQPSVPAVWERLRNYVTRGGSLAMFLGHLAEPKPFQNETARQLMAGTLARQWRSPDRSLILSPRNYDHPILAPFRERATSVPWDSSPIFRHWVIDDLASDAQVIMPYGNGKPALIERPVGKGRVLVMTTPISDPARPPGREPWNELPTSEDAWPYFVLVNEMMNYLSGAGQRQVNYFTGETATLPNDPEKDPQRYQLFTPGEEPQEISAANREVVISFTERPGAYRLKGNRGGPVTRGFAVNLPERSTGLARIASAQLDGLFGKDKFQLARNREEIQREVGDTRLGREFYPYLLVLLALVLSLEHLLANRFYQAAPATNPGQAATVRGVAAGT